MNKYFRALLLPFLSLAGVGFLASFVINIYSIICWRLGWGLPIDTLVLGLFLGLCLVFLPLVYFLQRIAKFAPGEHFSKIALAACPKCMLRMLLVCFAYGFLSFIVYCGVNVGRTTASERKASPAFVWMFSAIFMPFYSIGFTGLFAAYAVGYARLQTKCPRGHVVPSIAKFCEVCGATIGGNEYNRK